MVFDTEGDEKVIHFPQDNDSSLLIFSCESSSLFVDQLCVQKKINSGKGRRNCSSSSSGTLVKGRGKREVLKNNFEKNWLLKETNCGLWFWILVLCLGGPASIVGATNDDFFCESYQLDNECSNVVEEFVFVPSNQTQEQIFEMHLALPISDIRMMLSSSCRRSLIWFFCNTFFPPCSSSPSPSPPSSSSSSSSEPIVSFDPSLVFVEDVCTFDPSICDQIFENCESEFSYFSFSPSPSPSSFDELNCTWIQDLFSNDTFSTMNPTTLSSSEETFSSTTCAPSLSLEEAIKTPIPVETCISSVGVEINCCNKPFVQHRVSGECVVECYQFSYGKERELRWFYASFVLTCVSVVLTLISLIPLFLSTKWYAYPNFLAVFFLLCSHLFLQMTMWCFYGGGVEEFICQGEDDYYVALLNFLNSNTCIIQASIETFFLMSCLMWSMFLSLNIGSQLIGRQIKIFKIFSPLQMKTSHSVLLLLIGIIFPLSFTLYILIFGLTHTTTLDTIYFGVVPANYFCSPAYPHTIYYIKYMPTTVLLVITSVVMMGSFAFALKKNRHMMYYVWRSVFFVLHFMIVLTWALAEVLHYTPKSTKSEDVQDFSECVAQHPRTNDPPCKRQYNEDWWFFWIYQFLLYTWVVITPIVVFISGPFTLKWWEMALRSCTIPTTPSLVSGGTGFSNTWQEEKRREADMDRVRETEPVREPSFEERAKNFPSGTNIQAGDEEK